MCQILFRVMCVASHRSVLIDLMPFACEKRCHLFGTLRPINNNTHRIHNFSKPMEILYIRIGNDKTHFQNRTPATIDCCARLRLKGFAISKFVTKEKQISVLCIYHFESQPNNDVHCTLKIVTNVNNRKPQCQKNKLDL